MRIPEQYDAVFRQTGNGGGDTEEEKKEYEAHLLRQIHADSVLLFSRYQGGKAIQIYRGCRVDVRAVVSSILDQWFFPFLPVNDIIFITTAHCAVGASYGAPAVIAAAICVRLALFMQKNGWPNGPGGAEAVMKAACHPSFSCHGSLQDQEMISIISQLQ